MTKENILSKIASLFESTEENKEEQVEINLMEIVDKDGKQYQIDSLEVGSSIYVLEGEEYVLLVDGEITVTYEDKDWVIKSDETGKIASIEEVAVAEEEAPIEEAPIEEEMGFNAQSEIEKLRADFEALKEELKSLLGEKETALKAITKENEELKEKFSKLPAAEPVKNLIKKFEFKEIKEENLPLSEWIKTLKK